MPAKKTDKISVPILAAQSKQSNSADKLNLSDVSPKDKPWDKHRGFADQVQSHYAGSKFEKYCERVSFCSQIDLASAIDQSAIADWSNSATELIDTTPLPWTRGLLYFLLVFISVLLPWACLYKMDEIGTARGRLEFKGNTIKREADVDGSVAVVKVYVKKGDRVKTGQPIMELDTKGIREQIYQAQLKLDGQRQHLNQLALMKNQLGLGTSAQQQQNQAQLLEKQSQVSQADRAFSDRQASYNLQKVEKLTEQQRSSTTLTKSGKLAMLAVERQTKEIYSQIVTLRSDMNRDRAQLFFLNKKLAKYTIVSPTDGTIFELPIEREGAEVQPKQLIAEIAPSTNQLVFKGEIATDRSESLRSGERHDVKLKFDEFPVESYDIVKGHLTWVAPNSKIATTPQGSVTSYEVAVQLEQSCIQHEGKCIPFKSGQPATAEIVIRHRKIIDFVLDPFRKLANQGE